MTTLEGQMAFYMRYHRDPRNKATHFVGVPLITFSLLVPMSWLAVDVSGVQITLAHLFLVAVFAYYLYLDATLALALAPVVAVLLYAAQWAAGLGYTSGWAVFGAAFVGGWILQLVGHWFEGKRPALVDNIWQIFVAPLFLMVEALAMLGWKRDLLRRAEELAAH
ncbi:MAG TPA: Mpo1-like protein [Burkholderiales bacterium]|jgi:uncharacterized membrane protein YGL010W